MNKLILCIFLLPLPALAEIMTSDTPRNHCISDDQSIGDSAFWASSAVLKFANKEYASAIATVDACFSQWAPEAAQTQKKMNNKRKDCPSVGSVNRRTKKKIEKNYLINDVSMALWAKARSLHELEGLEAATQTYSQCVYMSCGRAWDPNGWYWSPASDCADKIRHLIE
ncbi:MAG: hypothetical protein P8Q37_05120 [Porticoccaceae bacterium]|nr:hypothetical protein [Porticoccaceae bacterium]MDG1474264.1 hypothetical protein [Porticoccaceae bacterium]